MRGSEDDSEWRVKRFHRQQIVQRKLGCGLDSGRVSNCVIKSIPGEDIILPKEMNFHKQVELGRALSPNNIL